jgi:hypothetical protein
MALEELDSPFVRLRRIARLERAEVAALAGLNQGAMVTAPAHET